MKKNCFSVLSKKLFGSVVDGVKDGVLEWRVVIHS